MSNSPEAEIKVQVLSLNPYYRQPDMALSFGHTCECQHHDHSMREPELDLKYVMVSLRLVQEEIQQQDGASMLVKLEDAKKLNLMVGDFMTIKLTKTEH